MAVSWYALRSKARKEDILWKQIVMQGVEGFFPKLRVYPKNPRSRKWVPYFPGYFFVRVDLDQAGVTAFQWIPHSLGLVSFGGEPAGVPDPLINALRKHVDEVALAGGDVFHQLKEGDIVKIQDGFFKGYEAIFDMRLPGKDRVRVLLDLLGSQRYMPLELDVSLIEKKPKVQNHNFTMREEVRK